MCFGVREGSTSGVCIDARAVSSHVMGIVCPVAAMQNKNNPAIGIVVRLLLRVAFIEAPLRIPDFRSDSPQSIGSRSPVQRTKSGYLGAMRYLDSLRPCAPPSFME